MKKSGFTLIELLVVIAILGILSAGILTAINVTSNLDKAKLAKAKTFSKSLENSLSVSQVGKWSFEESSGPFKDTSGNGNDARCLGSSCPAYRNQTECELGFGGCLTFDSGDVLVLPANKDTSLQNPVSTYAFWMDVRSFRTGGNNIANAYSGDTCARSGSININVRDSRLDVTVGYYPPSTNYDFPYQLQFNQWHHFAVVIDHTNSTMKAYVDGSLLGTRSFTSFTPVNSYPSIGSNQCTGNPNDYFDGRIDEVAIYNQALTAYQIQDLYAQGLARHKLAHK